MQLMQLLVHFKMTGQKWLCYEVKKSALLNSWPNMALLTCKEKQHYYIYTVCTL